MSKPLTRKIFLIDSINDESYEKFSRRVAALERESTLPIEVELMSSGGDAYSALAFSGRMRSSKCQFVIKAYGFVASAAVMILAAGDVRAMTKETWVMVHEDSGKANGSVTEMQKVALQWSAMEDQWATLLAEYTTTTAEVWRKLHNETKYLTATQCLDLGLIDEIV